MARMFEVAELVKVAINDEKTGAAFYTKLSDLVRDAELAKTFATLAEQERGHQQRFEAMLAEMGDVKPPDLYPEQYLNYVTAMTADRAFPDEDAAVRQAQAVDDDREAIRMALRIERDTLVLMNDMRNLVRDKDRAVVDELIKEEQQHVIDLTDARDRLGT